MTKHQLENELATSAKLPLSTAVKAIDGLIRIAKEKLAEGEEISIRGFGTLSIANREERKGRNPKTGEEVLIPAHRTVTFKISKEFKETLNN
ncbi:HU family DNA-binding protein [uncultured Duncaniella sp.]|uniref:HU family DNA-binding protein n=1 Tax=uncultured Duncaniella sp. TaxID=2768039 RepID=UPI0027319C6D|nr:HU family DNA-binding protein [uncultured Duncaniella sp.]